MIVTVLMRSDSQQWLSHAHGVAQNPAYRLIRHYLF
jgi:hypothetical protein